MGRWAGGLVDWWAGGQCQEDGGLAQMGWWAGGGHLMVTAVGGSGWAVGRRTTKAATISIRRICRF